MTGFTQTFVLLVGASCVMSICAMSLNERTAKDSESQNFITYVSGKTSFRQTFKITDNEIEFNVAEGKMRAVIDFKQELMTFIRSDNNDYCFVVQYNQDKLPRYADLKEKLERNKGNQIETETRYEMKLTESNDQSELTLGTLSEKMCDGMKKHRLMEVKSESALAKSSNDSGAGVGWGEVLVIVVVILVLG